MNHLHPARATRDLTDLTDLTDPADLARLLDRVAHTIAEHGTGVRRPLLEQLAAATTGLAPGAAAALVDPTGTEVARLRAFAVLHGRVLALDPASASSLLDRLRHGVDLPRAS